MIGAWGVLAFDDDDGNDWEYGLEEADDLSVIESAFDTEGGAEDYLEAPEASNALAACEVLARLSGKPGNKSSYTQKADEWVAAHPQTLSAVLLNRANAVIDRILGENSELKELWADSDENNNWLALVDDPASG